MTTTDTDVAAPSAVTETSETIVSASVEPVVRIDGELAGRLLASARWQQ